MKPRRDWKSREIERALALHRLFLWVEGQRAGSSLSELYTVIRPIVRKLRTPFSWQTFYRLFTRWQRKPEFQSLVRKWKSGVPRISEEELAAVAALAVNRGQSVAEVLEVMKGRPFSVRTAYRRIRKTKQISRLARITRKRDRVLAEIAEPATKSTKRVKAQKPAGKGPSAMRPRKRRKNEIADACSAFAGMSRK